MNNKLKKLFSKSYFLIFFAIIFSFFVSGLFLYFCGYNPFKSFDALLKGIFSKPKYIAQVIIESTPIILTGLSVAFAFKCGLFNIGAEGQYIIGTITATILGTQIKLPPIIHFLFILIISIVTSGIWGAIVGFLKARFGINEVITSIMLNWIAFYLYKYIFSWPCLLVRDLDTSVEIVESARGTIFNKFASSPHGQEIIKNNYFLSDIFKTDLNCGIFIAVIVIFIINYLLYKTTKGFELRAVGLNQEASKFVGINVNRNIILSMFISGAIAGLAGALQLTCIRPYKMLNLAAFEGYGNEGIYVALVANCSPIGCLFSGLFFGAIKSGCSFMQVKMGTPREIIKIIMGLIVLLISVLLAYRKLIAKIIKSGQVKNHE